MHQSMSDDKPFGTAVAVILLESFGGYHAPERPVVALVAPRQSDHDDNEESEPEQKIHDPCISEISVGSMDSLGIHLGEEAWVSRIPEMPEDLLRDALRVLNRYAVTLPNPDLPSVRAELENHLTDGNGVHRDDVSEIMQKIDDLVPSA
jgi:hypothetical protein